MHEQPFYEHVINDSNYYSDEVDDDMPISDIGSPNNNFANNEECVLDMLYDDAFDEGPILLDNLPCLEIVTSLWEDKNDILVVCNDTLTHESPTIFLSSPHYTIEEKYAYVEKYLCAWQLSLVSKNCCNDDS